MANNDGMNFDIDLDINDESGAVSKLNSELEKLMGSMRATSAQLNQFVKRQTSDINKAFNEALQSGQQVERIFRRLSAAQAQSMGNFSRGTPIQQQNNAAVDRIINEFNKSDQGLQMKLTEALVKSQVRIMKNANEAVVARLKREMDNIERQVMASSADIRSASMNRSVYNNQKLVSTFGDPGALQAKQRIDEYNRQRMFERASNIDKFGSTSAPTAPVNILDRFNSNGGADIMAVQARLMAGYQALNLFFSAVRNGATFIVELDNELKQFQAITATSSSEMVVFKDRLIEVAQVSKFTAVELAQAATIMGQAGLSAREVGDTLQAVSLLATASGSELKDAVDVVTSAISIFNLQTSEAVDIANTMTAALNESKLSIDKIALGLQYAGNIAAESGVGYKELLAVLGTLSNAGIKSGSTLGTGFRQLVIDIQNPTEKFVKALKDVGLTTEDVNIKTKGFVGVLKTLHDAGFGTAQAFEAFEVRAASAFAALDGNLNAVTQMQESLTRTSAALDANSIQMESLMNKASRFASNFGIVMDTMFSGLVDVLKEVLDSASAVLAKLNEYPKVLKTIGTILSTLGAVLIFGQVVAVVRGLSTAFLAMAGVVKGAEIAVLGLNIALSANPWMIALTAIGLAVGGLAAWNSTVDEATDKIDKLKGSLNNTRGDIDATNQTLKGLADVREQLMNQRDSLDNDPILRRAKILEVVDAFKELSIEIDSSTSSVADLISAIDRLSDSQIKLKDRQLTLEADQTQSLISKQMDELKKFQSGVFGSGSAYDAPEGVNYLLSERYGLSGEVSPDNLRKAFKDMVPDNYGYDRLFDIAGGTAPAPDNMDRLQELQQTYKEVENTITKLREKGDQGSKDVADALEFLLAPLNEVIKRQSEILNNQAKIANITDQKKSTAAISSSSYKGLSTYGYAMVTDLNKFRTDTFSGKSSLSNDEKLSRARAYADDFEKQIKDLDKIASEGPEEVYNTFKSVVLPKMTSALSGLNSVIDKGAEGLIKEKDRAWRRSDKVLQAQIATLTKRSSNANTVEEVEALEQSMMRLMDLRKNAIKELYADKIMFERDPTKKQELEDALIDALSEVDQAEQQQIEGYTSRQEAIRDAFLRLQKSQLEDQINSLKKQISETTEAMAKLKPGEAMNKLRENINKMAEQLARLMQESGNIDLTLKNPNMSMAGPFSPIKVSANQSARMQQGLSILMAQGYSKTQAAGLMGHFTAESGLDPNIIGDGGKAYGVAQWHPDRQARLKQYLSNNELENSYENQVKFAGYELEKFYPKIFNKLKEAQTVDEAVRFSAGYEAFKGYNTPTDPASAENYRNRIGYAKTAYGLNASDAETLAEINTKADAVQENAVIKEQKALADATVKNFTEQMQTQIQQAKNSGDPKAVMKMIDTVDEQYKKIIDERTKEFDATYKTQEQKDAARPEFDNQIAAIQSENLQKTSALIQEYWSTVQQKGDQAVKLAQMKLDEAQKPENVNKYTAQQLAELQGGVNTAKQVAQQQELAAATQLAARANAEAASASAQYGANSEQVRFWSEQEAQAKQKVLEVTQQKNAADAATAQQGPSVSQAIQSANQQWAIQSGLMQRTAGGAMQMVPLATQVGNAWGEVLNGMTNNLSTLFMNLASGTMSAKEAFKQFAMSTIQMFMQMIAKALAYQIILGTIGKVGSSGGSFLSGILGIPGAAQGEYIKGAAQGEVVSGGTPHRDSVLRKVMPGELILRKSAVDQIGKKKLVNMNAMGNRSLSEDGNPLLNQKGKSDPNTVNVWIVSPEQQPQMGPNDVVAVISDHIQRRGHLKQLIKEVHMGR